MTITKYYGIVIFDEILKLINGGTAVKKQGKKNFKILSLFLSLVMILTALPLTSVTAFAEDETHTSGDFEYLILFDGTAEITDYTGSAETLDIPSKLDEYTVTSIGLDAFADYDSLTSVTIPESVTSIGNWSFYGCESLTSITIPGSVTRIGTGAFMDCTCLTRVTIPDSVTSIGHDLFNGCDSLTSIKIPDNVTSIGDDAFYNTGYYNNASNWENGVLYIDNCLVSTNYDNLPKNYTVNDGTRIIAYRAFYECDGLISITIPGSVKNISAEVLYGCKNLTSAIINNGVTSIGHSSFEDCYNLTSVTIPNSVTSIDDYAFRSCLKLEGITIPNSVTDIGVYAFQECDSLTSVIIPESVKSLGYGIFWNCDKLSDIYILNKECFIGDYFQTPINKEVTIHGYENSTAAEYANKYGNKFVALEEHPSMEKVPEKAAACTEDGNIEYFHCSDCNKNFKDEYGFEEIADVVVKATGHKYENGVCTVCGEKEPVNPEDPTNPDNPVNPSDPTNPDNPKPTGEVSGDGKLSTVDAKWILQNIAKSRDFSDEQSKAADLNGDGKLSVVDVKWVLQIIAGMRDAETLEPIK